MRSSKKSWEERLAGWIPYVLCTTSCTLLLIFLGIFLIVTLPGILAESPSIQEALSALGKSLPIVAICALALAHVIWSFRFASKIKVMSPSARLKGWVIHLVLGAPLLVALACLLGVLGVIFAMPEVVASLLSAIGLLISVVSRQRQMPDTSS